jgi:undecaprenyl-phosphate galactose phosphotransferase
MEQPNTTKSDSVPVVGLTRLERAVKRFFDILVASVIAVLFCPLILLVALAVRCSNGPNIIFSHTRIGRDGREFQCYKFRSMVHDAQERLQELLTRDPVARQEWDRDHKLKNDPRVTVVGRLIRKTSLDELPQLWNVIRGDMSVVGPRPVIETELERYGDARTHYLAVRPGLTGPWQVSGRNDIGYAERVEMDTHYVQNWNLLRDTVIVLKTATVILAKRGAY